MFCHLTANLSIFFGLEKLAHEEISFYPIRSISISLISLFYLVYLLPKIQLILGTQGETNPNFTQFCGMISGC